MWPEILRVTIACTWAVRSLQLRLAVSTQHSRARQRLDLRRLLLVVFSTVSPILP